MGGLARGQENDVAGSTIHEAVACVHLLRCDLPAAARWLEQGLAIARANGAARSECTLLGKRGLLHLARGTSTSRRGSISTRRRARTRRQRRHADRGREPSPTARWRRARSAATTTRADLERARALLRDPPDDQVDGRMLRVCEVAGRGFAAVRAGEPPREVRARAKAATVHLFARAPALEWDVVLRLLAWVLERTGDQPTARPKRRGRRT